MDKYTVKVSNRAKLMLGDHVRFMANASVNAAKETKSNIMAAVRSLKTMPFRYPFLQDDNIPKNKYRKMFVADWYLVLYQVKEQTIYVDYVVDCRQDYGWLIQ